MPGSAGLASVGPQGLTLKAWAIVNGSTGAIVAGSGLTFATKPGAGTITLTIAAQNVNGTVIKCTPGGVGGNKPDAWANLTATTTVQVQMTSAGAGADLQAVHLEVWAP